MTGELSGRGQDQDSNLMHVYPGIWGKRLKSLDFSISFCTRGNYVFISNGDFLKDEQSSKEKRKRCH
jgi:hypothetical protein